MKPNENEANNMKADDKVFLQHSKNLMDDSVEALNASTLSRLNRVRQHALQTQHKPRWENFLFGLTPVFTVFAGTTVAVIVALLWTAMPTYLSPELSMMPALAQQYEDIDMLTSDADLELLEDMEFISWLADENSLMSPELHETGFSDAS